MGPNGCYRDNYPPATLRRWARHIQVWLDEEKVVYVYFDNDQKSAAPADASQLIKLLRSGIKAGTSELASFRTVKL